MKPTDQNKQGDSHIPEAPPYRPPSEANSVLVRVTRGCSWNRCTFCGMYKQTRFSLRSVADITADLIELSGQYPQDSSIFLADSDSLIHRDILEIVKLVKQHFPASKRITSYSRLTTLRKRPLDFLCALREAGLNRIHAGLESGSADILTSLNKGITPEQAISGGQQARQAGFSLCFYILSGIGGEDHWQDHADGCAHVINKVRPEFIRFRAYIPLSGTPLGDSTLRDEQQMASPLTRLREVRSLIDQIVLDGTEDQVEVRSDHFSNYIWVDHKRLYEGIRGSLPADKTRLLAELDSYISQVESGDIVTAPSLLAKGGRLQSM